MRSEINSVSFSTVKKTFSDYMFRCLKPNVEKIKQLWIAIC